MNLSRFRRHLKTFASVIGWTLLVSAGLIIALLARREWLKPAESTHEEVYPGVTYRVDRIAGSESPLVHSLRVNLDNPRLKITVSQPNTDAERPFRLAFAEWKARRGGYAALINGARYKPAGYLQSLPGRSVLSVELVIGDGQAAGNPDISRLIWWDSEHNVAVETDRPPPADSIEAATHGIGLLTLLIRDGEVDPHGADPWFAEEVINRTFIGVDLESRTLSFFAFEKAKEFEAADYVRAQGVVYGGQLDSGSSTQMVLGRNPRGLRGYSGFRGWRPIASYIAIKEVEPGAGESQ